MTITVWEFFGDGDPFFGGKADDRVLYLRGGFTPVFLRGWERTKADVEARFASVDHAEAAVAFSRRALPESLRPRPGALLSYMKDVTA